MVIINKDKDIIMTGSEDKKIIIWDAKKMKSIKTIHTTKKINNLIAS
jgi:WD40 repeat protein